MSNRKIEIDQVRSEHRSLAILRILNDTVDYRQNSTVMLDYLRKIALCSASSELENSASNLESQGLIKIEQVDGNSVYELTEPGQEVARGLTEVEGIAKLLPGSSR